MFKFCINILQDVLVAVLNVPEGDNLITTIKEMLDNTIASSIKHYRDYGGCKEPQRKDFVNGFEMFLKFLRSTEYDIKNRIMFEVSHALYKGYLLTPHQITAASKNRERVTQVEKAFNHWMRQIQVAITEGKQIKKDPHDVGPLNELEYWRSMLTKYASIVEFVGSRPFANFLTCLTLSHSKLVKVGSIFLLTLVAFVIFAVVLYRNGMKWTTK
jgi:dynein heavy chain, axonemal